MLLHYVTSDGEQKEFELGEKSITIGRGTDVDISIPDKLASRIHCGISFWDNSYFLRDFNSRNHTYLNDRQIEVARINPGDRIKVGDTVITVSAHGRKGTDTVINEVRDQMDRGKGYHTILHEIIEEEKKT